MCGHSSGVDGALVYTVVLLLISIAERDFACCSRWYYGVLSVGLAVLPSHTISSLPFDGMRYHLPPTVDIRVPPRNDVLDMYP